MISYFGGGARRHGAAVQEDNWDSIAQFIIDPSKMKEPEEIVASGRSPLVVVPGVAAPVLWLILAGVLIWIGYMLLSADLPEWQKTIALVAYVWGIWKIGTYV